MFFRYLTMQVDSSSSSNEGFDLQKAIEATRTLIDYTFITFANSDWQGAPRHAFLTAWAQLQAVRNMWLNHWSVYDLDSDRWAAIIGLLKSKLRTGKAQMSMNEARLLLEAIGDSVQDAKNRLEADIRARQQVIRDMQAVVEQEEDDDQEEPPTDPLSDEEEAQEPPLTRARIEEINGRIIHEEDLDPCFCGAGMHEALQPLWRCHFCNQTYHQGCIDTWMQESRTCPHCRQPLP